MLFFRMAWHLVGFEGGIAPFWRIVFCRIGGWCFDGWLMVVCWTTFFLPFGMADFLDGGWYSFRLAYWVLCRGGGVLYDCWQYFVGLAARSWRIGGRQLGGHFFGSLVNGVLTECIFGGV